jgi:putative spermidine/putrescine transport system permease protein
VSLWVRIALFAFIGLVLAFLVLPALVVVPASFNQATFIRLPPDALSLRWYAAFFRDPEWRSSFLVSVNVAAVATTLSLALGAAAAFGLQRLPPLLYKLLFGLFLAPLIVPAIITAIALYYVARPLGLVGTVSGLALGHALLCIPFVVVNVGVSLRTLEPALLLAAEGLGAGPLRVFRTVTLPAVAPGLVGATVFAFVTSFDEVVLSVFLSGIQGKTMPVKMWETIRVEFTPVTAVAASFLLASTFGVYLLSNLVRRRRAVSP